ncbi:MAG TPA: DUF4349 domain-containing protein [Pyrinomonadaceae bacterium]|nr:DUF4349 domain-containing protein [Pyrinomonadaceae bacterium]
MKHYKFLALTLALCFLTACAARRLQNESAKVADPAEDQRVAVYDSKSSAKTQPESALAKRVSLNQSVKADNQVSLDLAGQSQTIAEAMDRKILRNADLTLECSAPQDTQRKIGSIAESMGGFVVTSESKQRQTAEGATHELEVNLVIRVPAAQFGPALDQIRSTANRVVQEKITGQDVTEEFIDLEAHLKTQKALESQFLDIMKQAHKVEDALEVQRQIAGVRSEIEKLEGRKRFLENRASLSTITVSLQTATAIAVNTSGFGRDVREAVADSVQLAIAIVLFLIRFVIVMIPVFLLIILPGYLITRHFVRHARTTRLRHEPEVQIDQT